MNTRILLMIGMILISGCAQNYVRITEYEGDGIPYIKASAKGCVLNQEGSISADISYSGDRCQFQILNSGVAIP